MLATRAARYGFLVFMATALVAIPASPAGAQQAAASPNSGSLTVTTGADVLNAYMFRGIRQDDTKVITWPFIDLGLRLFSGEGALKSAGLNVGTWNSLHTGAAGLDGPSDKLWYEGDFYATLAFGLGRGLSAASTYTAYTSPNNTFTTVEEIAFKLALDDTGSLGAAALRPYSLVAIELQTLPGVGQADAGERGGTYLELGVAPGWSVPAASLTFPVKIGLSLKDYYELAGVDHKFGYASVAGIVAVPLGGVTRLGSWNLHGGLELQSLGTTTQALNNGDARKVIGSIGFGLSY